MIDSNVGQEVVVEDGGSMLSSADVIFTLTDEPNNEVGIQVFFKENPPDITKPSSWIAEFLLVNWAGIVQATARARMKAQVEEAAEDAVVKPEGLKLVNPNGGFVN